MRTREEVIEETAKRAKQAPNITDEILLAGVLEVLLDIRDELTKEEVKERPHRTVTHGACDCDDCIKEYGGGLDEVFPPKEEVKQGSFKCSFVGFPIEYKKNPNCRLGYKANKFPSIPEKLTGIRCLGGDSNWNQVVVSNRNKINQILDYLTKTNQK